MNLLSECCNARPREGFDPMPQGEVVAVIDKQGKTRLAGFCSKCKEWTDFYDEQEPTEMESENQL